MARYFTADPHLGHRNIIDYCNRPFTDTDEMDEAFVAACNQRVSAGDELWILGDVALGRLEQSLAHIGRLHGTVHLVAGNHDRCWGGHRKQTKARNAVARYLDAGFASVSDHASVTIAGRRVELNHLPYAGDHTDTDRFAHARPADRGAWLLCGHVHDAWVQRGRMINVGVDVRGFAPVAEDEIAAIIAAGPADR